MAKFRPVSEADRDEVSRWIEADPGHAGKMTADFFLHSGQFHSLFAANDDDGTVMYLRCEAEGKKMRVHIQFGPDRKRIMRVFREGFPQVCEDAKVRGFLSIVFDSSSPALVKWMLIEFHFTAELECSLVRA